MVEPDRGSRQRHSAQVFESPVTLDGSQALRSSNCSWLPSGSEKVTNSAAPVSVISSIGTAPRPANSSMAARRSGVLKATAAVAGPPAKRPPCNANRVPPSTANSCQSPYLGPALSPSTSVYQSTEVSRSATQRTQRLFHQSALLFSSPRESMHFTHAKPIRDHEIEKKRKYDKGRLRLYCAESLRTHRFVDNQGAAHGQGSRNRPRHDQ